MKSNFALWKFTTFIVSLHALYVAPMKPEYTFLKRYKSLLTALLVLCIANTSLAQSTGCLSTYSRFGVGLRNDESLDWQRAMGGVGVAMPSGNRLNNLNPASYAYIDSLTFIFDAGMTAGFGRMVQGGNIKNVKGITLDHIVVGFRLTKNLGLSFGFRPYSTVGYSFTAFTNEQFREMQSQSLVKTGSVYSGSGGINKVFAGIGWRPFGHLSIGMHAGVLWGNITNQLGQGYTVNGTESSNYDGYNFLHYADIQSYHLDFGTQYAQRLSVKDWLTIGATVGVGHTLHGQAVLYRYLDNSTVYTTITTDNAYSIPMTYALGLSWQHANNLIVSADAHYDAWSQSRVPTMQSTSDIGLTYPSLKGMYRDNVRFNIGSEWTPDIMSAHYYKRIRYRLGFHYSNAYEYTRSLYSNDYNSLQGYTLGPWETGLTFGVGLPLTNSINYHAGIISMLNIGMEWMHRQSDAPGMVKEDYLMLNLGIQFNERWFKKYKIQ